jgi:diketogulonate reductase-like aldo/keto reductase
MKEFLLKSQNKIPSIGFGTFLVDDEKSIYSAIKNAGYRMLDCASIYKNEELVGKCLEKILVQEKFLKRSDLFIISKVWPGEMLDVESALKRSLSKLKVDYLDLYLVHWPIATEEKNGKYERIEIPMYKIWAQMVKSIGVSNFNVQMLWDMMTYAKIPPAVNEIEFHPFLTQKELFRFMKDYSIIPIGYFIFKAYRTIKDEQGMEKKVLIVDDPTIKSIAEKNKCTPSQVLISWGIEHGCVQIPKSTNSQRQIENILGASIQISKEDMKTIDNLNCWQRIGKKHAFSLGYDIFA